jgi:hypothetical protein
MTEFKDLQMRFLRWPSRPIKRRRVLKMAKPTDQEKKPKDPNGNFPEAHKEVHYIFGGSDSYEPKRKQKLTSWEVLAVGPATLEYLRWSEVPITFDHGDHPDFIPKLGRYPLVVCPIVKDVNLNRVLVDGGNSLNLLFLKTFDQMRLSRSLLCPSRAPFHGIVPRTAATPIGQISLPVTFGTRENFWTKNVQFEVANFETAYNAFLGRMTPKLMAIPHYAYLVLKIPGPCGVISIRGDVKQAYNCDKESYEMAKRLSAVIELLEMKESLVDPPGPGHAQLQGLQNVHPAGEHTQQADTVVYGGAFQGCSHRQHIGS